MTMKIDAVCLGWQYFRHWIPAPAFAGVTFFRRNDGVECSEGGSTGSPRTKREVVGVFMPLLSNACPLPLSAEGWVAFGAAGLFVAGQVAYLG